MIFLSPLTAAMPRLFFKMVLKAGLRVFRVIFSEVSHSLPRFHMGSTDSSIPEGTHGTYLGLGSTNFHHNDLLVNGSDFNYLIAFNHPGQLIHICER
jgi:hypothetical protein